VSPEELAYLIQDAERVEARALAAMGRRVPLVQSLQNATSSTSSGPSCTTERLGSAWA
jgi:hypothetical protein